MIPLTNHRSRLRSQREVVKLLSRYVCMYNIYIHYLFIYLLSYFFIYYLYAYVFTPHILGDSFSHDPSFLQSQGPPGQLQAFGVARVTRVTWPLRRCESMGQ